MQEREIKNGEMKMEEKLKDLVKEYAELKKRLKEIQIIFEKEDLDVYVDITVLEMYGGQLVTSINEIQVKKIIDIQI